MIRIMDGPLSQLSLGRTSGKDGKGSFWQRPGLREASEMVKYRPEGLIGFRGHAVSHNAGWIKSRRPWELGQWSIAAGYLQLTRQLFNERLQAEPRHFFRVHTLQPLHRRVRGAVSASRPVGRSTSLCNVLL